MLKSWIADQKYFKVQINFQKMQVTLLIKQRAILNEHVAGFVSNYIQHPLLYDITSST